MKGVHAVVGLVLIALAVRAADQADIDEELQLTEELIRLYQRKKQLLAEKQKLDVPTSTPSNPLHEISVHADGNMHEVSAASTPSLSDISPLSHIASQAIELRAERYVNSVFLTWRDYNSASGAADIPNSIFLHVWADGHFSTQNNVVSVALTFDGTVLTSFCKLAGVESCLLTSVSGVLCGQPTLLVSTSDSLMLFRVVVYVNGVLTSRESHASGEARPDMAAGVTVVLEPLHTITSLAVLEEPASFSASALRCSDTYSSFEVVAGSKDGRVHIFDGNGEILHRKKVNTSPITHITNTDAAVVVSTNDHVTVLPAKDLTMAQHVECGLPKAEATASQHAVNADSTTPYSAKHPSITTTASGLHDVYVSKAGVGFWRFQASYHTSSAHKTCKLVSHLPMQPVCCMTAANNIACEESFAMSADRSILLAVSHCRLLLVNVTGMQLLQEHRWLPHQRAHIDGGTVPTSNIGSPEIIRKPNSVKSSAFSAYASDALQATTYVFVLPSVGTVLTASLPAFPAPLQSSQSPYVDILLAARVPIILVGVVVAVFIQYRKHVKQQQEWQADEETSLRSHGRSVGHTGIQEHGTLEELIRGQGGRDVYASQINSMLEQQGKQPVGRFNTSHAYSEGIRQWSETLSRYAEAEDDEDAKDYQMPQLSARFDPDEGVIDPDCLD